MASMNTMSQQEIISELYKLRAEVTQIKQSQNNTTQMTFKSQLRPLLRQLPLAVAILDKEQRFVTVSDRWLDRFHLGNRDVSGLSIYEIIPDLPDRWKEKFTACVKGEILSEQEDVDPYPREDGTLDYVTWSVYPLYQDDRHPSGLIIYCEFVTESVEADEQREVTIEELRKANTHKNQFMATVSHELRTPLNAIIGHSGVMLAGMVGNLDDRTNHKVQSIYDSANHLLNLINDILDLQKIESGQIDVQPTPIVLKTMMNKWLSVLQPRAEEKKLELSIICDEHVPEVLIIDERLVTQIVINLGYNSIKFTSEGEVSIVLEWQAEPSTLLIRVSDTGIGIPASELDLIFEEFHRIRQYTTDEIGTGLGLAIVRRLIRAMNGKINVTSQVDEGTTFNISIPVRENKS